MRATPAGDEVAAYEYHLPESAIAQVPVEPRDSARLLDATGPGVVHRRVADLPSLVGPGDVVVVNETEVIAARLRLRRRTGGQVEVLLLEPLEDDGGTSSGVGVRVTGAAEWSALVKPSARIADGEVLLAGDRPVLEVGTVLSGGRRTVRVLADDALHAHGEVPLPPYIHAPLADSGRYQTVFARRPGSVAAPTAGLHLTAPLLERCRERGAVVAPIDLSVGIDTFRPLAGPAVDDHVIHSERYRVPDATFEACERARRVIAVGTTTVRALESAATGPSEGRTSLFIRPGFQFRLVDVLMTNFHMPRSSLLVLLAAFTGDRWRDLYACALDTGYRFLSFGDAMLVGRHT